MERLENKFLKKNNNLVTLSLSKCYAKGLFERLGFLKENRKEIRENRYAN
ncbi:hypothetical protein SAMN03097699_1592 [Flavobacteriaceae bacterium MAR_2010_188]|nr:hypothetical protein SAMN03097699_1592 [Flavobacteriaceae bacterium MAR_2010_188]